MKKACEYPINLKNRICMVKCKRRYVRSGTCKGHVCFCTQELIMKKPPTTAILALATTSKTQLI